MHLHNAASQSPSSFYSCYSAALKLETMDAHFYLLLRSRRTFIKEKYLQNLTPLCNVYTNSVHYFDAALTSPLLVQVQLKLKPFLNSELKVQNPRRRKCSSVENAFFTFLIAISEKCCFASHTKITRNFQMYMRQKMQNFKTFIPLELLQYSFKRKKTFGMCLLRYES